MRDTAGQQRGDRRLQREALAFSGAVAASLSHELNNTLAIINEHAGLLQDLLSGLQQGAPLDERKVQRISKKIAAQVERGNTLIKRLNRFSHSADVEEREIDLNELLREIVDLSQRLAGLRMVQLELRPTPEAIRLTSNPFFLQQAVFIGFGLFWEAADANPKVSMSAESHERGVKIRIAGTRIAELEATLGRRELLQALMEELKGGVEYLHEGADRQSVVLSLCT